jgi:hypothetical protein
MTRPQRTEVTSHRDVNMQGVIPMATWQIFCDIPVGILVKRATRQAAETLVLFKQNLYTYRIFRHGNGNIYIYGGSNNRLSGRLHFLTAIRFADGSSPTDSFSCFIPSMNSGLITR